jgi:hypothetical protein
VLVVNGKHIPMSAIFIEQFCFIFLKKLRIRTFLYINPKTL